MQRILKGITANGGIACGRAFIRRSQDFASYTPSLDVETERERFMDALEKTCTELEADSKENEIFEAHLEIARDEMLSQSVTSRIEQGDSAVQALEGAQKELSEIFLSLDDEYLRSRVDDLGDIFSRIRLALTQQKDDSLQGLTPGQILFARDLTPSDLLKVDLDALCGIVTELGSTTSHVSIIARSKGIPAIVGIKAEYWETAQGEDVILDATNGCVILSAEPHTRESYTRQLEQQQGLKELYREAEKSTIEGISVMANAASPQEVKSAVEHGAQGIGLLRSEFIYMQHESEPDEQTQLEAYVSAAQVLSGKPLTIRTLDAGADKQIGYLGLEKEDNPFLGLRAVRLCLSRKAMFRTQLRAILRASERENVRMMIPMIADLSELKEVKTMIAQCKEELSREGKKFNPNMPFGIMIETPAAVLMAKELASEVDFFSIGTNDLTQYIMAADRGNPGVSYLYSTRYPAVRKAIEMVIRAAEEAGIECGMCGEMASDPLSLEFLLKAGLRELSVSVSSIGKIKYHMQKLKQYTAPELESFCTEHRSMIQNSPINNGIDDQTIKDVDDGYFGQPN